MFKDSYKCIILTSSDKAVFILSVKLKSSLRLFLGI